MRDTNIPTVMNFLFHIRPELEQADHVSAQDFFDNNLPFFGGCQECGASIAAHNACFGRNGFLVGTCCADEENAMTSFQEIKEAFAKGENEQENDYEESPTGEENN